MAGLQDYLNSEYIERLRFFAMDRTRNFVFVYVEGDDDIAFWTHALDKFGDQTKFQFLVTTNKKGELGGGTINGKDALLKIENLGPKKIVCVDADFDLLIDNYSVYSQTIRDNDYVVHTTYYSIENILFSKYYFRSLFQSLKIEEYIDVYEEQLEWVSLVCQDIFLLLLCFSKEDSENRLFWFKDFSTCLDEICTNDIGDISKIQSYKKKWEDRYSTPFSIKKNEISTFRNNLTNAEYKDEELYELMRGHDLYNSIIKPWFEKKIKSVIKGKIKMFQESHSGEDIPEYRKTLFEELGSNKSLKEAIDFHFYNNKPISLLLPKKTEAKISKLFS